jgi:hypothetical protein
MTATLGRTLIFKLDGTGAGLLQGADGMADVDGVAETSVGVDNERQIHHASNGHCVLGDLAEVHEAEIRQAEVHIGEPGARQINRLESQIRDDPGGQCVRGTGHEHALFLLEQRTQRGYMWGRHRTVPFGF